MNTSPKKRGRPKSQKTLTKEHIDFLLSNPPEHINMTAQQVAEQNEWLQDIKNYLKKLHAEFNPTIPHSVIENLASINDESMEGYEKLILDAFYKAENAIFDGQRAGGEVISQIATKRAQDVWLKNPDLMRRIRSKNLSLNGASKKILEEWDKRGDEQEKPSIRTLSNWYKRN